ADSALGQYHFVALEHDALGFGVPGYEFSEVQHPRFTVRGRLRVEAVFTQHTIFGIQQHQAEFARAAVAGTERGASAIEGLKLDLAVGVDPSAGDQLLDWRCVAYENLVRARLQFLA